MTFEDLINSLPGIDRGTTLQQLDLSNNFISVGLSEFVLHLNRWPYLKNIYLQNNLLGKNMSVVVGNRELEKIDLSGNNIIGGISHEFANLPSLKYPFFFFFSFF